MTRFSRYHLGIAAVCLLAVTALAAPPARQAVSYPSGDATVKASLYLPAGAGKHPAIVVIHEWWGLNPWIEEQAADLAAHGYVALAVDLYRGKVANDPEMAHELMRGLPQDRGVRDLVSAVAYLESRPDVDPGKVGAIGWCMGGGYALQLAIHEPSLKAVSINYGSLATDPEQLAKLRAEVAGNFGGKDRGITPDDVQQFAAQLKKLGVPVDVKIYPEAAHGFENPNNQAGYRAGDAADAQRRSLALFARVLGGRP